MKVAVTGAGGLIGRALVPQLARDERVAEVLAIDLRPPATSPPAKVRTIRRDVRDGRLARDLAGADAVVHLAFRVLDAHRAGTANVEGARNVFGAAVKAGVRTIVHASSGVVYGSSPENPVPLDERHPLRPGTFPYPRDKAAVEGLLADLAARRPDVRIVCMRPTTVLGPGAPLLLADRAYVSSSGFDPPHQFTWVDDVAGAFVGALHEETAQGAYNVGAPGTVRQSEVARLLGVRRLTLPYRARRAAAGAMTRLRLPGAVHPWFVDFNRYPVVVSSARAEAELGWRATCDSAGTLRRFAETLTAR